MNVYPNFYFNANSFLKQTVVKAEAEMKKGDFTLPVTSNEPRDYFARSRYYLMVSLTRRSTFFK